jgi:hypothetical protein
MATSPVLRAAVPAGGNTTARHLRNPRKRSPNQKMTDGFQAQWDSYSKLQSPPPLNLMPPRPSWMGPITTHYWLISAIYSNLILY